MYKKVTYEIDDVRMVSKYYPGNFGAPGVKRADRRRRTAEEVKKNNDRIRIRKLQRIILANFREGRTVHLTYRKDERPESMEEAMKQRKEFLKRMRKECRQAGIEWKFIIVTEKGKRGQALHHHMIIEDRTEPIDLLRTISRLWQFGRVTSTKMEEEDDGFSTLADYLLKKETKTGCGTSYSRSRNLVIPQPKAELVRRRKWTKEPKAPAGWYIVKGSVWNAYTPGGWPVQRYTMRRIVEKPAGSRKTCARQFRRAEIMICYVDITTDFKGGQRGSGTASVVIWAERGGERHEAGPFHVELEDGTRNRLAIMAVNEGLKHFNKPGQDIVIRMRETYVKANLQYLDAWHERDYKKAGGKSVANEDEWRKLWLHSHSQKITVEIVSNAAV